MKRIEKYFVKEAEKKEEFKYVKPNALDSMLRYGSHYMNPQKINFIQELIMPYHKTVRKIANPKVSTHEKRKLLKKAQVGEGVLKSFNLSRANYQVGWKPSSRIR